jgi:hypothetical protein
MSKPACVGVATFKSPARTSTGAEFVVKPRSWIEPPTASDAFVGIRMFSGRPPVRVLARALVRGLRVRLTTLALLFVLATEFEREGACPGSPWRDGEAGEGGPPMGVAMALITRERGNSSVEYAFSEFFPVKLRGEKGSRYTSALFSGHILRVPLGGEIPPGCHLADSVIETHSHRRKLASVYQH